MSDHLSPWGAMCAHYRSPEMELAYERRATRGPTLTLTVVETATGEEVHTVYGVRERDRRAYVTRLRETYDPSLYHVATEMEGDL